ncbi:MAG: hypothetical protein SPI12_06650 [Actinomycetaceae bacterium]|nr:hypothetical protein [Actinomycetaceae bacterium]MDY6083515.1 hypothetical protein [Actinomycetaceae bacterium]
MTAGTKWVATPRSRVVTTHLNDASHPRTSHKIAYRMLNATRMMPTDRGAPYSQRDKP